MTYRDYLHKKRRKKKPETDSLGDFDQSYTTYKDVLPMQFPNVNQPAGGPMGERIPNGFGGV